MNKSHLSKILKKVLVVFLIVVLQFYSWPILVAGQEISPSVDVLGEVTLEPEPILSPSTTPTPIQSGPTTTPSPTLIQADVSETPSPTLSLHPQNSQENVLDGITGIENFDAPQSRVLNSLKSDKNIASAKVKLAKKFRNLIKRHFRADEKVTLVVENADVNQTEFKVFNFEGEEVATPIEQISDGDPVVLRLTPSQNFKPGRYRVKMTDDEGKVTTQDFTWGVLAINTNKSIYHPSEKVELFMAVLDETGMMVCDAGLELQIKNQELGIESRLSTQDGSIKVNPECQVKDFTMKADYEAQYQLGGVGVYEMTLTAQTKNGEFVINDAFEVRSEVPFDVERITATRIYPPHNYPVTLNITANQDFEGEITEIVPESFSLSSLPGTRGYDKVATASAILASQKVLEAPIFELGLPFEGEYKISQKFGGQHKDPLLSKKYTDFGVVGHDGVDFPLPSGSEVWAAAEGEVVRAQENSDYGTTVVIQHSWGKSYYGHLSKLLVTEGQRVKKGENIALSGSTGLSSNPHLHFGIKPNQHDMNNGYYGKINSLPYLGLDPKIKPQPIERSDTGDQLVKVLTWNINLKKGEKISLGYQFLAPQESPQFYLLGPLEFKEEDIVFQESRQWQIASDVVANIGVLVAYDNADANEALSASKRTSADTLAARYDITTINDANRVVHTRTTALPHRQEEVIAGGLRASGRLDVHRCIGGACDAGADWSALISNQTGVSATLTCSDTTSGTCWRPFDVSFESLKGRAMIAYGKAANDGILYYKTWDGTTLANEASFTFNNGSAVDTRWIYLARSPISNQILALISDANNDLFAMIWDGTSAWGDLATMTTGLSSSEQGAFGGDFESVTNNIIVAWGEGTTEATNPWRYKTYVQGAGWDGAAVDPGNNPANCNDAGVSTATAAVIGRWVEAKRNDDSNRVAFSFMGSDQSSTTTDSQIFPAIWKSDGSTVGFTFATGLQCYRDAEGTRNHNTDVAWEKYNSGTPFAIFVGALDGGGAADTSAYSTWTSGSGFGNVTDLGGAMLDDNQSLFLRSSPNSDDIIALGVDYDNALHYQRWTNSAWSLADWDDSPDGSAWNVATGTNNQYEIANYSYDDIPYGPWSTNWHFYDGVDTTNSPTTSLADENVAPTTVSATSGKTRLRFAVQERGGASSTDARKKLQHTTGCNPNTSETTCTWTDVDDPAGSGIWRYVDCNGGDAAICNDNQTLSAAVLGGSPTAGWWVQDKDAAGGSNMDHTLNTSRELEYSIEANSAVASTTYYFRMYDVDQNDPVYRLQTSDPATPCTGTVACSYPSLTTSTGCTTPTTDQQLRHGNWFCGGSEQSFTF